MRGERAIVDRERRTVKRGLLVLVAALVTGPLAAQDSTRFLPQGSTIGGTIDRLRMDEGQELSQMMIRFTSLEPNTATFDTGIGLLVADGLGGLAGEAGPAFNIGFNNATLLLRAGFNVLLASGGGLVGGYAGAALIAGPGGRVALRLEVARHEFAGYGHGIGGWMMGAGLVVLPKR